VRAVKRRASMDSNQGKLKLDTHDENCMAGR